MYRFLRLYLVIDRYLNGVLRFRSVACHRHPSPVCHHLQALLGNSNSSSTTTTTATDNTMRMCGLLLCVCGQCLCVCSVCAAYVCACAGLCTKTLLSYGLCVLGLTRSSSDFNLHTYTSTVFTFPSIGTPDTHRQFRSTPSVCGSQQHHHRHHHSHGH